MAYIGIKFVCYLNFLNGYKRDGFRVNTCVKKHAKIEAVSFEKKTLKKSLYMASCLLIFNFLSRSFFCGGIISYLGFQTLVLPFLNLLRDLKINKKNMKGTLSIWRAFCPGEPWF